MTMTSPEQPAHPETAIVKRKKPLSGAVLKGLSNPAGPGQWSIAGMPFVTSIIPKKRRMASFPRRENGIFFEHFSGACWLIETPTGSVGIRFVPANDFGVLDHVVKLPDGQAVLNPMRVVANGDGSEVMFTLLQLLKTPDDQFAKDAEIVEADLRTLKSVMEAAG